MPKTVNPYANLHQTLTELRRDHKNTGSAILADEELRKCLKKYLRAGEPSEPNAIVQNGTMLRWDAAKKRYFVEARSKGEWIVPRLYENGFHELPAALRAYTRIVESGLRIWRKLEERRTRKYGPVEGGTSLTIKDRVAVLGEEPLNGTALGFLRDWLMASALNALLDAPTHKEAVLELTYSKAGKKFTIIRDDNHMPAKELGRFTSLSYALEQFRTEMKREAIDRPAAEQNAWRKLLEHEKGCGNRFQAVLELDRMNERFIGSLEKWMRLYQQDLAWLGVGVKYIPGVDKQPWRVQDVREGKDTRLRYATLLLAVKAARNLTMKAGEIPPAAPGTGLSYEAMDRVHERVKKLAEGTHAQRNLYSAILCEAESASVFLEALEETMKSRHAPILKLRDQRVNVVYAPVPSGKFSKVPWRIYDGRIGRVASRRLPTLKEALTLASLTLLDGRALDWEKRQREALDDADPDHESNAGPSVAQAKKERVPAKRAPTIPESILAERRNKAIADWEEAAAEGKNVAGYILDDVAGRMGKLGDALRKDDYVLAQDGVRLTFSGDKVHDWKWTVEWERDGEVRNNVIVDLRAALLWMKNLVKVRKDSQVNSPIQPGDWDISSEMEAKGPPFPPKHENLQQEVAAKTDAELLDALKSSDVTLSVTHVPHAHEKPVIFTCCGRSAEAEFWGKPCPSCKPLTPPPFGAQEVTLVPPNLRDLIVDDNFSARGMYLDWLRNQEGAVLRLFGTTDMLTFVHGERMSNGWCVLRTGDYVLEISVFRTALFFWYVMCVDQDAIELDNILVGYLAESTQPVADACRNELAKWMVNGAGKRNLYHDTVTASFDPEQKKYTLAHAHGAIAATVRCDTFPELLVAWERFLADKRTYEYNRQKQLRQRGDLLDVRETVLAKANHPAVTTPQKHYVKTMPKTCPGSTAENLPGFKGVIPVFADKLRKRGVAQAIADSFAIATLHPEGAPRGILAQMEAGDHSIERWLVDDARREIRFGGTSAGIDGMDPHRSEWLVWPGKAFPGRPDVYASFKDVLHELHTRATSYVLAVTPEKDKADEETEFQKKYREEQEADPLLKLIADTYPYQAPEVIRSMRKGELFLLDSGIGAIAEAFPRKVYRNKSGETFVLPGKKELHTREEFVADLEANYGFGRLTKGTLSAVMLGNESLSRYLTPEQTAAIEEKYTFVVRKPHAPFGGTRLFVTPNNPPKEKSMSKPFSDKPEAAPTSLMQAFARGMEPGHIAMTAPTRTVKATSPRPFSGRAGAQKWALELLLSWNKEEDQASPETCVRAAELFALGKAPLLHDKDGLAFVKDRWPELLDISRTKTTLDDEDPDEIWLTDAELHNDNGHLVLEGSLLGVWIAKAVADAKLAPTSSIAKRLVVEGRVYVGEELATPTSLLQKGVHKLIVIGGTHRTVEVRLRSAAEREEPQVRDGGAPGAFSVPGQEVASAFEGYKSDEPVGQTFDRVVDAAKQIVGGMVSRGEAKILLDGREIARTVKEMKQETWEKKRERILDSDLDAWGKAFTEDAPNGWLWGHKKDTPEEEWARRCAEGTSSDYTRLSEPNMLGQILFLHRTYKDGEVAFGEERVLVRISTKGPWAVRVSGWQQP